MMRTAVRGGLALLLALATPAVAGGAPVHAAPLTRLNWLDATYTSACFASHAQRFVAHNGVAQAGFVHFQVYTPIFADLTGDGRPEALVPYSCTGADFGGVHVFVYTGAAAQPHLLGEIPSPRAATVGGLASMHTVTVPTAPVLPQQRALTVAGVGFSASATHACPDVQVTQRYRVEGGRLVAMGIEVTHASRCLSL